MTDYEALMRILSQPRPNGSRALRQTSQQLQAWLKERSIPFEVHHYRQYPYFFELIGLWLIISRSLLAAAVWLRWGWAALPIAILGLIGGTLDVALNLPLVTWLGAQPAENVIITLGPSQPRREVVISAHYDTKTELLDHMQRMFLLKSIRSGILISLLLGLLGPLDAWLRAQGSVWAVPVYLLSLALSLPMLALAWALGLNLVAGRLLPPSRGAIDNGAACAVLFGLAERAAGGKLALDSTRLTLAIFSGEEVKMQGSLAYTSGRGWPLPAAALNLEVMAQDGDYVLWDCDGNILRLIPTTEVVNRAVARAVRDVTGRDPVAGGPVNSDGAAFLHAGLPTGVLGTYDRRWKDRGFHRPSDNLERLVPERLPEGVEILARFVQICEEENFVEKLPASPGRPSKPVK